MARPKISRRICSTPAHSCFKPNGVPMKDLQQIVLLAEEFEAIRLADVVGANQQESADQMGVSRQTFGNIIKRARGKIALSIVEGKALMLQEQEQEL